MRKAIDYIGVSAGAMIFNNKGELFLSKRSQGHRRPTLSTLHKLCTPLGLTLEALFKGL